MTPTPGTSAYSYRLVLRILCEHVEFLQPVGQFLGDPLSTPALPSAEAVPPAPEAEPTRGS
jgi:hypothetical protein